jgi:hypothetical protein
LTRDSTWPAASGAARISDARSGDDGVPEPPAGVPVEAVTDESEDEGEEDDEDDGEDEGEADAFDDADGPEDDVPAAVPLDPPADEPTDGPDPESPPAVADDDRTERALVACGAADACGAPSTPITTGEESSA